MYHHHKIQNIWNTMTIHLIHRQLKIKISFQLSMAITQICVKQTIIGSTRISNLKKTPWTGLFCKYFTNLQKKNSYCKKFFLQNVEEVVLLCKKTTTIFSKQKMYNSKSFQKEERFLTRAFFDFAAICINIWTNACFSTMGWCRVITSSRSQFQAFSTCFGTYSELWPFGIPTINYKKDVYKTLEVLIMLFE